MALYKIIVDDYLGFSLGQEVDFISPSRIEDMDGIHDGIRKGILVSELKGKVIKPGKIMKEEENENRTVRKLDGKKKRNESGLDRSYSITTPVKKGGKKTGSKKNTKAGRQNDTVVSHRKVKTHRS